MKALAVEEAVGVVVVVVVAVTPGVDDIEGLRSAVGKRAGAVDVGGTSRDWAVADGTAVLKGRHRAEGWPVAHRSRSLQPDLQKATQ